MMLLPHKKKIATIIIAGAQKKSAGGPVFKPGESGMSSEGDSNLDFVQRPKMAQGGNVPEVEHHEGSSDDSYAFEQMAQDMLSAVASKDAKRLAEALKSFCVMCDEKEDEEDGEEYE